MNRARRLLNLAYMTHQRGEVAIAARIATLAFEDPDAKAALDNIGETTMSAAQAKHSNTEDAIRKAEALSNTSQIFTEAGIERILTIAEKLHKAGYPKVAKSLVQVTK